MKINRILCPTDFSDAAINAVEYAAQLAKKNNATLTLWNMNDLLSKDISAKVLTTDRSSDQREQNHQILQDWSEQINIEFDINCEFAVVKDNYNLQKTLDIYLDGESYDIMVTGTNGVSSVFQFHFGTNSYNILNKSKIPVLVVPSNCVYEDINSVIYLMDYQESDAENIQTTIDNFHASVTALHISEHDTEASNDVFKAQSNSLDSTLISNNKVKYKRVLNKQPIDGLIDFLGKNEPDLIVLSHLNRTRLKTLFQKSFTKSIVETIGYPILVMNENNL